MLAITPPTQTYYMAGSDSNRYLYWPSLLGDPPSSKYTRDRGTAPLSVGSKPNALLLCQSRRKSLTDNCLNHTFVRRFGLAELADT